LTYSFMKIKENRLHYCFMSPLEIFIDQLVAFKVESRIIYNGSIWRYILNVKILDISMYL